MAGPLMGILGQAGGAMFGSQVGQALGGLAGEVLSASDIGLPLGPAGHGRAAARQRRAPSPRASTSAHDDVLLYLALREAAHQRLFAHVPWLRAHLLAAVEDYGRGTTIDVSKIESSMRDIDPTNPAAIQEALEGGLFEPEKTPAQQAALTRLETALALVEGWVDEVVGQATEDRMPAAGQAAGGRAPAPRRRRSGRVDVRRAGRARAAAAPAARRLRAVGLAALPQGPGGPRRRLGAPRPAAHRRPTSTTRSASRRARCRPEALTDDEFDAALAELLDNERRARRRRRPQTRDRRLHDDALATLRAWRAPDARAGRLCARSTSTT